MMTYRSLQTFALYLSGATALGVGALILAAPVAFYAHSGITLGRDPNLLSELRAPAAGLAGFGLLILAGAIYDDLRRTAAAVALTLFAAFAAGRLLGMLVDGLPSYSVMTAFAIEFGIAALCVAAFRDLLRAKPEKRPGATQGPA